eukprot:959430-Prymnesium_polylepis.1
MSLRIQEAAPVTVDRTRPCASTSGANGSTHRARKLPVLPGLPGFRTSSMHAPGKIEPPERPNR